MFGIEIQTSFGDVILKNLNTIQIKTLLIKNALINIDIYLSFDNNGKTI